MRGTCHCGMWNLCRLHICFVISLAGIKHVNLLGNPGQVRDKQGDDIYKQLSKCSADCKCESSKPPSPSGRSLPRPNETISTLAHERQPSSHLPAQAPLQPPHRQPSSTTPPPTPSTPARPSSTQEQLPPPIPYPPNTPTTISSIPPIPSPTTPPPNRQEQTHLKRKKPEASSPPE